MEGDSRQEEEAGEIRGVEKGGNANGIGRAASGTREASEAGSTTGFVTPGADLKFH